MPKHGKKFRDAQAKVPPGVQFKPEEAVQMVKDLASAKFDETVDISTCLNVDPRKADQIVRGTVVLPHGTGTVDVVEGGLEIVNDQGTDATVMAHAAAVVYLDVD